MTFCRYFNTLSLYLRTDLSKVMVIYNDQTILMKKVVNNDKKR